MARSLILITLLLAAAGSYRVEAASLRVAPISINLDWPSSAATIKLRNDGERPIDVQVRVFGWTQAGGADQLLPTRDVVVSPPITRLDPGVEQVVRVVRVIKTPISGEESYRLVVDELPSLNRRRAGNVSVLLRYSLPLFVTNPEASPPSLSWQLERFSDGLALTAHNSGEQRIRVADLSIATPDGRILPIRSGLLGYVLGQSTMRFALKSRLPEWKGNGVRLIGNGEAGAFYAAVEMDSRH